MERDSPGAHFARAALRASMQMELDDLSAGRVPPMRGEAMPPGRTLTDADIEALADTLTERLEDKLYRNIGKGVWGVFQKAVIAIVIAVAFYGSIKGIK